MTTAFYLTEVKPFVGELQRTSAATAVLIKPQKKKMYEYMKEFTQNSFYCSFPRQHVNKHQESSLCQLVPVCEEMESLNLSAH